MRGNCSQQTKAIIFVCLLATLQLPISFAERKIISHRLVENVEWLVRAGDRWMEAVRKSGLLCPEPYDKLYFFSTHVSSDMQQLLQKQSGFQKLYSDWQHKYKIPEHKDDFQPWMVGPLTRARESARPVHALSPVELLCQLALCFPDELLKVTEALRFAHFDQYDVAEWNAMFMRELMPPGTLVSCSGAQHSAGSLTKGVARVRGFHVVAATAAAGISAEWEVMAPLTGKKKRRMGSSSPSTVLLLPVPAIPCYGRTGNTPCTFDLMNTFQIWVTTWLQPGRHNVWVASSDTALVWNFNGEPPPHQWRRLLVTAIPDIAHITTLREDDGRIEYWSWDFNKSGPLKNPFGVYITPGNTTNAYTLLTSASFGPAYLSFCTEKCLVESGLLPLVLAELVADYCN